MATGLSLAKRIQNELAGYAPLAAIVTGGIYTRPIIRDIRDDTEIILNPTDPTFGATPDAFDSFPPYRIKPCISIAAGTEERNSNAPTDAMWAFPSLFVRTQPKDTEKAKMEDIFLMIRRRLHLKQYAMPSGSGCIMSVIGRMGPMDDRAIKGAVVMVVTLQIDGIWEVL